MSIIKNKKIYNAIGGYFNNIENIEDIKFEIIYPLINTNLNKNISMTKVQIDKDIFEYKLTYLNKLPAIRNTAYNELSKEIKKVHSLLYYYSKKEYNLLSYKQTHNIYDNVCHTLNRSIYLDIINLIEIIKLMKKEKIVILDNIIELGKNILKSSISDDEYSPLEYVLAEPVLCFRETNNECKLLTIYPRLKYDNNKYSDMIPMKLKNLQTVYFNELAEQTNTNVEKLM